jgi:hypothetical protein
VTCENIEVHLLSVQTFRDGFLEKWRDSSIKIVSERNLLFSIGGVDCDRGRIG